MGSRPCVACPPAVTLVHESLRTVLRVRRFGIAASPACAKARIATAISVLSYRTISRTINALETVASAVAAGASAVLARGAVRIAALPARVAALEVPWFT